MYPGTKMVAGNASPRATAAPDEKANAAAAQDEKAKLLYLYSDITMTLGKDSRAPVRVALTALVYLRRFFARHSVREFDALLMGVTALWAAYKFHNEMKDPVRETFSP